MGRRKKGAEVGEEEGGAGMGKNAFYLRILNLSCTSVSLSLSSSCLSLSRCFSPVSPLSLPPSHRHLSSPRLIDIDTHQKRCPQTHRRQGHTISSAL